MKPISLLWFSLAFFVACLAATIFKTSVLWGVAILFSAFWIMAEARGE